MIDHVDTFNNAHIGYHFRDSLDDAFSEIVDILKAHCGPYANYAAIGTRDRRTDSADEHTKDGIKILSCLLSDHDAIRRYAARITRFIGITIDSRCHDGTTTAMTLFAYMASSAMKTAMRIGDDRKALYRYRKDSEAVLASCLTNLDRRKITVDDITTRAISRGLDVTPAQTRTALAYHQAMIASKGDHEISSAIAQVITATPIHTYSQYTLTSAQTEQKERVKIKRTEHDLSVRGAMGQLGELNVELGTEFYSPNAVVFSTCEELTDGVWETGFLNALIGMQPTDIKNRHIFGVQNNWFENHNGRQLIILSPMLTDGRLISNIKIFNAENPENHIIWMNIGINGIIQEIFDETLHALGGTPSTTKCDAMHFESTFLHDVEVRFKKDTITFNNLYERDDGPLVPKYRDPEHYPDYHRFVTELQSKLDDAENHPENAVLSGDDLEFAIMMYRYLTCQTILDVEIGGTVHENFSIRTVYQDAMGAAISAVTDGVVLGGYAQLARLCDPTSPFGDELLSNFKKLLLATFAEVDTDTNTKHLNTHLEKIHSKWDYLVVDPSNQGEMCYARTLNKQHLSKFYRCEPGEPILFQPYVGFVEQFTRFADLLPKLITTSLLIDTGHIEHVERRAHSTT